MDSKQTIASVMMPVEVPVKRVIDILVNGFENGAFNYWMQLGGYENLFPNTDLTLDGELMPSYGILPVIPGCAVVCRAENEEDAEIEAVMTEDWRLDLQSIRYGLGLLYSGKDKNGNALQPRHLKNFHEENDDVETADVLVQLSLFGEIIFG